MASITASMHSMPCASIARLRGAFRGTAAVAPSSRNCYRPPPSPSAPLAAIQLSTVPRQMRYSTTCAAAAPEAVTASSTKSTLQDLDLRNILSPQGLINPEVAEGSQGYVFAIYDEKQKTQYIGFSKDLRHSLRTVFSRRPDKAFYYKMVDLPELDQKAMIEIRDQWFEQLGGAPSGNKLAMERDQWQKPVDAGAISQRGKQGAAEEQARQLLEMIKQKGCKEEWIPNDALLAEGLVDFLPAKDLTPEELEIQKQAMLEQAKNLRQATAIVDGVPKNFQVLYHDKYPTNGGFMVDMTMIMDGKETEHRVIVGKGYYEPFGISPEAPIEAALALLLGNKMPRHTEGIINSSTFPVNYFSVSELEQWFGDQYVGEFLRTTGFDLDGERDDAFWRFNKINDYGPLRIEKVNSGLGEALERAQPGYKEPTRSN